MSARTIRRALPVLATLAFAVVACGGPAATATPGTTEPGGPTAPVITAPPATPGGTGSDLPTFALPSFQSDAELEELFPDELGGEPLTVLSMSGGEFMGSGGSPELDAALGALGKSASDLSVAFGGTGSTAIIAFQVDGVPGGQILDALFDAFEQETKATITDASFAGKSVKKVITDGETSYIYTAQDVVFIVGGESVTDAQLTEALSKLP